MKDGIWIGSFLLTFTLGIQALSGVFDAGLEHFGSCNKPMARIEYVFPGYRIGCWLGRAP